MLVAHPGSKEEIKRNIITFSEHTFLVLAYSSTQKKVNNVPPGKTEKQSEGNPRKTELLDKECHLTIEKITLNTLT